MKTLENCYPIKILSFFCDEKNNFQIKYQYANKRVVGTISLTDFLKSPLMYAIDPMQIYQLGFNVSEFLMRLETPNNTETPQKPSIFKLLKRVFYQ